MNGEDWGQSQRAQKHALLNIETRNKAAQRFPANGVSLMGDQPN
jgi:hypothetical protein